MRVLYVDDEEALLDLAREFLKEAGDIDLLTAKNASEGLSLLASSEIDVVVSDYLMPQMDGIEFLKTIRNEGNHVPFILFTGKGREEVIIQALNEGADFYLQKGMDLGPQFHELVHMIRRAYEGHRTIVALEQKEERLRKAEEKAKMGHFEINLLSNTVALSRGASTIIGTPSFEIPLTNSDGCPWLQYFVNLTESVKGPDTKPTRVISDFRTIRMNDNAEIDVHLEAEYDDDKKTIFGIIQDISERVRSEERLRFALKMAEKNQKKLKLSELRFRGIFEMIPIGLWLADKDGRLISGNPAGKAIWAAEPHVGPENYGIFKAWKLPSREPIKEKDWALYHAVTEGRVTEFEEIEIEAFDGKHKIILNWASPIKDEHGDIIGAFVINQDITERRRMEQALQQSEEAHRAVLEHAGMGVEYYDPDGKLVMINNKAAMNIGYEIDKMIGRSIDEIYGNETSKLYHERLRMTISSQRPLEFEDLVDLPRGKTWLLSVYSKVYGNDGRLLGVQVITHDITKRKSIEEELLNANKKLNLLGSISRHDIMNHLTTLQGYLDILSLTKPDLRQSEAIDAMRRSIASIAKISNFMKIYQEVGQFSPIWHNIAETVSKASSSLDMTNVKQTVNVGNVWVLADPMFEMVIHNLIRNSLMHGERVAHINISFIQEDGHGTLVYEDDGVGVSNDVRSRLFTPGFGKNSGFGLFLSREILGITEMSIEEKGTYGKGARFEIMVPDKHIRYEDPH
ncbi:MAG: PAS domain S-box protein [Methanomassiliicoccales archaeon]|nr:MAG: PAS domain S-box protein [Methanomassiliicoccales archaeon]